MANYLSVEALKGISTEDLEKYKDSLRDQIGNLATFLAQVNEELNNRQPIELEQAS